MIAKPSPRVRRFTVAVVTCALVALASAASAGVSPEVQKHFDQGNSLYQDGRYEDAIVEYNAAYELSKNWKILYNRGQCLVMLKREPEAVADFEQYLKEGGAQVAEDRRKQIEADLPKLRARIGKILIEGAPPGSRVKLDGRVIGPTPLPPIPIGAGVHDIEVDPPEGISALPFTVTKLPVTGGSEVPIRVEFKGTAAPMDAPPMGAPAAPPVYDQPPPLPPAVLPPRPPGGLAAPAVDVVGQVGAVVPSGDYWGVSRQALLGAELGLSYRASPFWELGVFAAYAGGKPKLDPNATFPHSEPGHGSGEVSIDPNASYSYGILGVRGRMHLLRTKRVDGWFGVDFGAWQETWKFTGQDHFDFTAASPVFALSIGLDVPVARSWAIGASGRFLSADASQGHRENCATTFDVCGDGYLPGEPKSGIGKATARGFLEFGVRVVWVLPFGEAAQSKSAPATALSPAGNLW